MKNPLARLTGQQRLMLAAFALGLFALVIGNPGSGARASIDTRELARLVQTEADHVTTSDLAAWLIDGRADFRLVDLRGEADYAAYHIPGAEQLPITALADGALPRNEKIVLYSEGSTHAAQAWMLLYARGYRKVYMLKGGLEAWQDDILFPRLSETASESDKAAFEQTRQVSLHFGGTPQTGGTPDPGALEKPRPKPPAPPSGKVAAPAGGKKKKEGC